MLVWLIKMYHRDSYSRKVMRVDKTCAATSAPVFASCAAHVVDLPSFASPLFPFLFAIALHLSSQLQAGTS